MKGEEMTNGEKLKEIFPDIEFTDMAFTVHAVTEVILDGVKGHISYDFWKYWWNAEYKEPTYTSQIAQKAYEDGKKDGYIQAKLEQEPTTKNNLAVNCISRQEAIDTIRQLYLDLATQKAVIDLLKILPSVTPQLSSELEKNSKKLDCISRADAIRVASGYCHPSNVAKELAKLPSVAPQEPKWISVSERLPEKDGEYLLWGKICEDDENNYCFIGEYDSCAEEFGYWSDHYDSSTLGFLDSEHIEYYKVLAWMPLPTPYEPQESEG